jgi:hypothetical protein
MAGESEKARAKLTAAWRAAGKRLLDEGYSPADVTETMLAVALASYGVLFGSATQAFNTKTSMGRLTLNVLLSFASRRSASS